MPNSFAIILGLVLSILAIGPASAQAVPREDALFTIGDVAVDETAENALAARERALLAGQRKALTALIEQIAVSADTEKFTPVPANRLATLVDSIDVQEERRSGVRYMAVLTIGFDPDGVRGLLREQGIRFSESPAPPALLLPVWQDQGRARLWDSPNPWLTAWQAAPTPEGLVSLQVPLGDLADLSDIDAAAAMTGNQARMSAISGRYGAARTIVALASGGGQDMGATNGLQITLAEYDRSGLTATQTLSVLPGDAALDRAVAAVIKQLEDDWKARSLMDQSLGGSLRVRVPVSGLEDWVALRSRLQRINAITSVVPERLTRRLVELRLGYLGDQDALVFALNQARLQLRPILNGADGLYELVEIPDLPVQYGVPSRGQGVGAVGVPQDGDPQMGGAQMGVPPTRPPPPTEPSVTIPGQVDTPPLRRLPVPPASVGGEFAPQ